MKLPKNKTKIVCTIGPASESPAVMEQMMRAGMDIARLNFSHGDLTGHRKVIENLRAAARSIARFKLPVWIAGVTSLESTCQGLQFSYGVYPVHEADHPDNWKSCVAKWLRDHEVQGGLAVLTEGPSTKHPQTNNRMEIIELNKIYP
jgi:pyruvate kinase